jgi:hypothetical protein
MRLRAVHVLYLRQKYGLIRALLNKEIALLKSICKSRKFSVSLLEIESKYEDYNFNVGSTNPKHVVHGLHP